MESSRLRGIREEYMLGGGDDGWMDGWIEEGKGKGRFDT